MLVSLEEELLKLIEIPSPSGKEQELLNYLEARLVKLGFPPERQTAEADRFNLLVHPPGKPRFLLTAHIDTFSPPRGSAYLEDGWVFGSGSADNKGGVAALLGLLARWQREKAGEPLPAILAFTVDEEKEGKGSEVLAASLSKENLLGAIVLEPTNLAICTVEAGLLEVLVTVKGKASHGSEFAAGKNAILGAASILQELATLSFLQASHPLLGRAGFNVSYIQGGSPELVVPELCVFKLDFLILPHQEVQLVYEELTRFLAPRDASYEVKDFSPPFTVSEEETVVQGLKKAYAKVKEREPLLAGIKSWTDAENLFCAGIPAVVFGPGELALAHAPGERVSLKEVEETVAILFTFLDQIKETS